MRIMYGINPKYYYHHRSTNTQSIYPHDLCSSPNSQFRVFIRLPRKKYMCLLGTASFYIGGFAIPRLFYLCFSNYRRITFHPSFVDFSKFQKHLGCPGVSHWSLDLFQILNLYPVLSSVLNAGRRFAFFPIFVYPTILIKFFDFFPIFKKNNTN